MLRPLSLILMIAASTTFWGLLLVLGSPLRLLTTGTMRRRVILMLAALAEQWARTNDWLLDRFLDVSWDIDAPVTFRRNARYLVISNHVSWMDIFVLLRVLRSAPFVRFFTKRGLFWLPIVGQACWALEFPFMHRYSPEYLERHPERRGRDLETTREACRRYSNLPVSIINFVEGTRFSRRKQQAQQSPFHNLLRPRIGGIAFVLASMSGQLDDVIDVTIAYDRPEITVWDFAGNRVSEVSVRVRRLNVPEGLPSTAITEPGPARERFRQWICETWSDKDAWIAYRRSRQQQGIEPT